MFGANVEQRLNGMKAKELNESNRMKLKWSEMRFLRMIQWKLWMSTSTTYSLNIFLFSMWIEIAMEFLLHLFTNFS